MRTPVNALVAVRTHLWDDNISAIVLKSLPIYAGIDFIILADETNGTINVDFEKVAHTDDFSDFPLPNLPTQRRLWYNADYALYALRKAKPDYKWYVVIEYDVVVTACVLNILEQVQKREIDFVAHQICEAPKEWLWFATSINFNDIPWCAYFPFMIISGRAIDHLLRVRYDFFKKMDIDNNPNVILPYCELFIPTALCSLPRYRYAELSEFVELIHYDYVQPVDPADPICRVAHTIVHPVLNGVRLIQKVIGSYGIASIFDANSLAMHILRFTDPILIEHVMRAYFLSAQQYAKDTNRNHPYVTYNRIERLI